jgi:hypothetical protein
MKPSECVVENALRVLRRKSVASRLSKIGAKAQPNHIRLISNRIS